jgi:hypothetical protein
VRELENNTRLDRLEDRVSVPWQAIVDGDKVSVLVDVEGVAGKTVLIDQIKGIKRSRSPIAAITIWRPSILR